MKIWKSFLEILANWLKIKNKNRTEVFTPFAQYFLENPLAASTVKLSTPISPIFFAEPLKLSNCHLFSNVQSGLSLNPILSEYFTGKGKKGRLGSIITRSQKPRLMEATVPTGTFNAAENFLYPSPDLCLKTILLRMAIDISFNFMT